jgi:PEP-CTERM motif
MHTLASFSVFANLKATLTSTSSFEFANANVRLFVQGPGPGGSGFQSSDDSASIGICCGPQDPSFAGRLTVSFANLSAGDLVGQFERGVSVGGQTFASVSGAGFRNLSAVPEPETYAMMVAGLGLLTFMLRRRRHSCNARPLLPSS